ncbi:MAG TPA: TetR/AcrR family transcriptional regulator [Pseudolabrys sp.]|jgi:AcrR family transcriptional regulator|nr:TetR/AcrR family transcriptional regulator [Pseudolabrys sp.]
MIVKRNAAEIRRRIIGAADRLFYSAGLRSVAMEAIAAEAGVTKRTVYNHYPSKDHLIAAWVSERHAVERREWSAFVQGLQGTLEEKLLCLFRELGEAARDPRWKGCSFARTAAELAGLPGHPALAVAASHKSEIELTLVDLMNSHGVRFPEAVAKGIALLYDGAIAKVLVQRDLKYAEAAAWAAVNLVKMHADREERASTERMLSCH